MFILMFLLEIHSRGAKAESADTWWGAVQVCFSMPTLRRRFLVCTWCRGMCMLGGKAKFVCVCFFGGGGGG